MTENNSYPEDPLDSMLDQESDDFFGNAKLSVGEGPEDLQGNVKNWTAAEFSNFYTRYKPHLERHAKRYLTRQVHAEEVVQDAFLYIMTSLPELDSEVGVLKFLKWKVRLLSYDLLRSSANNRERNVDSYDDFQMEDDGAFEELERADDLAVIRLALSQLQPRQREALVSSVFQEKSTSDIADQLGLNENATRQLLLRARNSFKRALVGEAQLHGKSASEILSVAVRKAAADAKSNVTKIGAFLLITSLSLGAWSSWNQIDQNDNTTLAQSSEIARGPIESQDPQVAPTNEQDETGDFRSGSEGIDGSRDGSSQSPIQSEQAETLDSERVDEQGESNLLPQSIGSDENLAEAEVAPDIVPPALSKTALQTMLSTDVDNAGIYVDSFAAKYRETFTGTSIEIFGGTGYSAFVDVSNSSLEVNNVILQIWIDGVRYFAVGKNFESEISESSTGAEVKVIVSNFYIVDEFGSVDSDSPLRDAVSTVTISFDGTANPTNASLRMSS